MGPLSAIALVVASQVAPAQPLPAREADPAGWWKGRVFYEIFVRSFQDSSGDGHGDLRGLISRLDLLAELGVSGLWLMPIYEGPADHGYAIADYDAIDPRYGTMEDALALIDAAHARDIAVLLDFVPNHVSREHPWFAAAEEGDRLAQDHFVWSEEEPKGWTVPWDRAGTDKPVWSKSERLGLWYYHAFGASMPDLDLSDRSTRAAIFGTARRWIERGADGFRVDAVRYLFEAGPKMQADLPENVRFLRELRAELPGALLAAEAWADTPIAARYLGDEVGVAAQLAFDFDRAYALKRALESGQAAPLEAALRDAERSSRPGTAFAPFATNHDAPVPRAGAYGPEGAFLSNAIVLTSGGVPFLWQGDELGLRAIDEHQMRRPMRWRAGEAAGFTTGTPWREIGERAPGDDVETQRAAERSVWRRTRDILRKRAASPALSLGVRHPVRVAGAPQVIAFVRHDALDRVLVAANLGEQPAKATVDLRWIARESPRIALEGRAIAFEPIPADPRRFRIRFGRPGIDPSPDEGMEQGLAWSELRGMGFSRDVSEQLRCAGMKRCAIRFQRSSAYERDPLEWSVRVPPGAYDVEVMTEGRAAPNAIAAEGEAMSARGQSLLRRVMVRDGRLSLRPVAADRGGSPATVAAIRVAPAPFRAAAARIEAAADRVTLTLQEPGVVEWRMDASTAEPAENTPLVREPGGRGFRATLGPWKKGSVRAVSWVVRTQRGDYLTSPDGTELEIAIR